MHEKDRKFARYMPDNRDIELHQRHLIVNILPGTIAYFL